MQEQSGCGCHAGHENIQNISSFASCGQSKFQGAGDEPREADAKMDFIYPPVVFPSNKILKVFGEANIRAMVLHHHSLLLKSSVGDMFPQDEKEFLEGTEKTADFFVEALGGGDIFSSKHGHPALRGRHFRFTIDEKGREIWLMMYKKTLKEIDFPKEFIGEFWNWIEPLSIRMINRRTTAMPPERYYFESIKSDFGL
ncbi:MAG TPA: globin [Campylobacterales bacterium]|nr:globin [Campylobacterales bacterium]